MREIIRGLASRGTAVFLNSHLLSEVEQVCDRVAVVDHGRVIASGTMDELLGGTAVRVRATGLTQADKNRLSGYGRIDDEGEQMTFANLDPDRVPELVASIVSMGGRVYEVDKSRDTNTVNAYVTGFLGTGSKPMPVSQAEVDRILNQVKEGVEHPKPAVTFEVGEQVRVSDGPFASFNGVVEEVDDARSRVKVAVSIFGRATPVELEFGQVEKL